MRSPTITFIDTDLGIEDKAQILSENVKKEVWNYLFKGKKAQAEIYFDEDGKEPKSGLNVA